MPRPILDCMDEMDLNLLLEQPVWQQVLEIYSELISQVGQDRDKDEQGTRWAERIADLNDVESDELSIIHGELIALGWITFQIEGRSSGLMYRITAEGKKASELAKARLADDDQSAAA